MKVTGRIVENFTLDEMACRDGTLVLSPEAVDHAQRQQRLREWLGFPYIPNSWYRSLEYNRTLKNSSDSSQHILGLATDIPYPAKYFKFSKERKKQFRDNIANWWGADCHKSGIGGGIGFYEKDGFFHTDSGKRKVTELTRWEG